MSKKDPIVEKERMERLRKIRDLAQRVHTNRNRIERNLQAIAQATKDNTVASNEMEADRIALVSQATSAGFARKEASTVDFLVGILVELPIQYGAPAPLPAPTMPNAPPWAE